MVKHMLRTNFLTLDKKSFFCLESLFVVLLHEDSFTKKWQHCVDDRFAQCSLLGPSSTALNYISIATEVCSLLLSVKWFFVTLNIICERKPCVCALCSITVTNSGVITVLELKATAGWGLLHDTLVCSLSLLSLMEIQVNHLIQTNCGTGRPTSFPPSLLEFYFFWRSHFLSTWSSLVPFCHWHEPHRP